MFKRHVFLLVVIFFSCRTIEMGFDHLFPDSIQTDWKASKINYYNPENLYEYIDGEAELYLKYGFRLLGVRTYYSTVEKESMVTVDIYDMGCSLNAFGLYSNYRNPEYKFIDIGTEGFVSEYEVIFIRNRYVVEIGSQSLSGKDKGLLIKTARAISERIGGSTEMPAILEILPKENLIDKTLRYQSSEMLSQEFLPGGLEAGYRINNTEVTGFIILFDDSLRAKESFLKLKSFHMNSGKEISSVSEFKEQGYRFYSEYHGYTLILLVDKYIVGATDLNNIEDGILLIKKIKSEIEK